MDNLAEITPETFVDYVIAFEEGDIDAPTVFKFFSYILKHGMINQFQGHYSRTARGLIEGGWLNEDGSYTEQTHQELEVFYADTSGKEG